MQGARRGARPPAAVVERAFITPRGGRLITVVSVAPHRPVSARESTRWSNTLRSGATGRHSNIHAESAHLSPNCPAWMARD